MYRNLKVDIKMRGAIFQRTQYSGLVVVIILNIFYNYSFLMFDCVV